MSWDKLLEFWAEPVREYADGFIHPADHDTLKDWLAGGRRSSIATRTEDFGKGAPRTGKLHLQLRPVPYVGNLGRAKVILAMINPTVGWPDYENESTHIYPTRYQANLNQQLSTSFAIDQSLGIRSWSTYYRDEVFSGLVGEYAKKNADSLRFAWSFLEEHLAILELAPYYAQNATMLSQSGLFGRLESSRVALAAMQCLASKPREDLVIICRWKSGLSRWGLTKDIAVCSESRRGLSREAKDEIIKMLDRSRRFMRTYPSLGASADHTAM